MKYIFLALVLGFFSTCFAETLAPVSGFAREFTTTRMIKNAKITILENGQQVKLNDDGQFGPILWPVGKPITMVIEKPGYRTTQSATMIVPKEGLSTSFSNVSLQPLDLLAFALFTGAMGKQLDENKCHVATTITAYHKILGDLPQGEKNATMILSPATEETAFYFGIFTDGPLKNYPNPFIHGLKQTSVDGGMVLANLTPRDEPYTMTAYKPGVMFSQVQFICRKGMFINMSPPQGPTVLL